MKVIPAIQFIFIGILSAFVSISSGLGNLDWSGYLGGSSRDDFGGATLLLSGDLLMYGRTYSSAIAKDCPLDTRSGGDAFWSKVKPDGTLEQTCILSGKTYSETINDITEDESGNLYLSGVTESSSGIATEGAHLTDYASGKKGRFVGSKHKDAFLVKVNSDLQVVWGTYIGGREVDNAGSVEVDADGNVYVSGRTGSKDRIATEGAYQDTFDPGSVDEESGNIWSSGFVEKFNPQGELVWGTYIGGPNIDEIHDMILLGNFIYAVGTASSKTGIATQNAYQTERQGEGEFDRDAMVMKFDLDGNMQWSTYFGGSEAEEGVGITADPMGNVYITGETESSDLPKKNNAFSGTEKAFVAKFNPDGNLQWSTYFGGNDRDRGKAITFGNNKIYIAGFTNSSSGIATEGVYQTTLAGSIDAFLTALSPDNGTRLWGTYFGGSDKDIGYQILVKDEQVILSGSTQSSGLANGGLLEGRQGEDDFFAAMFTEDGTAISQAHKTGKFTSAKASISAGKLFVQLESSNPAEIWLQDNKGRTILKTTVKPSGPNQIQQYFLPETFQGIGHLWIEQKGKRSGTKLLAP